MITQYLGPYKAGRESRFLNKAAIFRALSPQQKGKQGKNPLSIRKGNKEITRDLNPNL